MTTPTATQTKAEHTDSLILRELANGPRSVTDLCIAINHTDKSDSKRVDNRLQDLKQRGSVGLFGRRWHLLDSKGKPVHPPDATIPGAMRVTRVPVVGTAKAAAPSNGTRGVPSGTPIVPPAPPPPTKSPDVSERERAEAATRLENAEARKYLRGGLVAVLEALGRRPTRELLDDELVDQATRAAAERNVALASAEADGRSLVVLREIATDVGVSIDPDKSLAQQAAFVASNILDAIKDLREEGDEADALLKRRTAEVQAELKAAQARSSELATQVEDLQREVDKLRPIDPPSYFDPETMIALSDCVQLEDGTWSVTIWPQSLPKGRRYVGPTIASVLEDALSRLVPDRAFWSLVEIRGAREQLEAADAELAAVYRQLGISDPPPTAEERDRVIAELRTAAVEASSLRAKLQTAQDVIKRLEADLQRAQAEAGSHPTEAPPWTPPDRIVGLLFRDIADGALSAIGAGEDQGAELAVLALRSLHEAQLNLQALRHRHDAMLGFEVSHG
jgi:hypothetical protein